MQLTIKLDNAKAYISSGRMSNVFKSLAIDLIKFEEGVFYKKCQQENMYDYFNQETIFNIAIKETENYITKNKDQLHYKYYTLCMRNTQLNHQYEKKDFTNEINKAKEKVLDNKEVKEKLEKLKKLRLVNI